jgi:mRNA interferase HigB
MRPIKRKMIADFYTLHPNSQKSLEMWYKITKKALWSNFAQIRSDFPRADLFGSCVVFDIGGNKYRLITKVRYASGDFKGRIYIKAVLTHGQYDTGKWKTDYDCH